MNRSGVDGRPASRNARPSAPGDVGDWGPPPHQKTFGSFRNVTTFEGDHVTAVNGSTPGTADGYWRPPPYGHRLHFVPATAIAWQSEYGRLGRALCGATGRLEATPAECLDRRHCHQCEAALAGESPAIERDWLPGIDHLQHRFAGLGCCLPRSTCGALILPAGPRLSHVDWPAWPRCPACLLEPAGHLTKPYPLGYGAAVSAGESALCRASASSSDWVA